MASLASAVVVLAVVISWCGALPANARTFTQLSCLDSNCQVGCGSQQFDSFACYDTYDNTSAISWCDDVIGVLKQRQYPFTGNCTGQDMDVSIPLDVCFQTQSGEYNSGEYTCPGYPLRRPGADRRGDAAVSAVERKGVYNALLLGGRIVTRAHTLKSIVGDGNGGRGSPCPFLHFERSLSGRVITVAPTDLLQSVGADSELNAVNGAAVETSTSSFECKVERHNTHDAGRASDEEEDAKEAVFVRSEGRRLMAQFTSLYRSSPSAHRSPVVHCEYASRSHYCRFSLW